MFDLSIHLFPYYPHRMHEDLRHWLTLAMIPNFGFASLKNLAAFCQHDLQTLMSMDKKSLSRVGFDESQIQSFLHPPENLLTNAFQWLENNKFNFILPINSPDYPELLREISSPPLLLFVRGDKMSLHEPQIAIVGSRNPSEAGKQNSFRFAKELAGKGWTITSGLALGIDGFAHKGVIAQNAKTIAVLGSGVDVIYPRRHRKLADELLEQGGCLVSEFLPGTAPVAEHFPRRNRIVSGLSLGTLVVEAAIKSGSLITAYYALQQNREVFAIPGNINNPLAKGCHQLIKQGAKLVEQVSDIHEEFSDVINVRVLDEQKNLQKSAFESLATDGLLDSVDYDTTSVDLVAQRSGLPVSVVLTQLLEYELRGLVASVPGGYIKLGD